MITKHSSRIFLVDDDAIFLRALEHHLSHHLKFNLHTSKISSGEECLKKLRLKPCIVVLDYHLNGTKPDAMNGIDVLKEIKKTDPELIVIMLSSQDRLEIAVDTMKYGAFDYVTKNESAFTRIENAINNSVRTIYLADELNKYKRGKWMAIAFLILIIGTSILLQVFFPSLFDK